MASSRVAASFGAFARRSPGASRAARQQALQQFLDATRFSGQSHAANCKPLPDLAAAAAPPVHSYGAFVRQNPGMKRADRRAALQRFLDTTRGAPTTCATGAGATTDANAVAPHPAPPVHSYGAFVRENPGAGRADSRAAIARFLTATRAAAPTAVAPPGTEHRGASVGSTVTSRDESRLLLQALPPAWRRRGHDTKQRVTIATTSTPWASPPATASRASPASEHAAAG